MTFLFDFFAKFAVIKTKLNKVMNKYLLTFPITIIFSVFLLTGCEKEDKDAIQMDAVNKGIQIITGIDGKDYEVVDLGLTTGVLWATCNIGAFSPEQTGTLFAWGETEPKQSYEWSNYYWSNGDEMSITKYCKDKRYGTVDGKTSLEKADDVALATMGEGWSIPTETDFRDLLTTRNCTSKWCKLNGVGGYLFTSVRKGYEGNSIFIPLAGMLDHTKTRFAGEYGWYWCSSMYYDSENGKYYSTEASVLWLEHTDVNNHILKSRPRSVGLPIRPIYFK